MRELISALTEILKNEHHLNEEILFYLQSVHGIKGLKGLKQVLADQESYIQLSLLELLFSPDLKQMIRVEPYLNPSLTPQQLDMLRTSLLKQKLWTYIILPQKDRPNICLKFFVNKVIVDLFLKKLHLDFIPPPLLHSAPLPQVPYNIIIELRAHLRQKKLSLTCEQQNALALLLNTYSNDEKYFWEYINFFFWVCGQGSKSLSLTLQGLREQLLDQLESTNNIQRLLKRFPVEMLVSQRFAISIDSPELLAHKLSMTQGLLFLLNDKQQYP